MTTTNYRLMTHKFYGRNEEDEEVRYSKGDVVPLTESQYAAYKDKFAVIAEESKEKPATPTVVKPKKPSRTAAAAPRSG